jgi:hypothetical protein
MQMVLLKRDKRADRSPLYGIRITSEDEIQLKSA